MNFFTYFKGKCETISFEKLFILKWRPQSEFRENCGEFRKLKFENKKHY